jgi:hypothetical protein
MRSFHTFCLALLLFSAVASNAQTSTLFTVEANGARGSRVNLVFLSEGYTSVEMGQFAADVQAALDFLFTKEPWVRYRSYCNIYRIQVASNQSGTDSTYEPRTGPKVYRDTYFHSGFVTDNIDRLNIISFEGETRAYSLLNQHVPEYDIPIVMVNDPSYGGSGGPVAVTTTHADSSGILEHELGHSFGRLTDEYDDATPGYPATEYPNATAQTARAQIRWNVWIDQATPLPTPENSPTYEGKVGLFEGANYRASGWYRPHDDALMRNLFREPGSVTREAFILKYYGKISPIDGRSPTALNQTITSQVPLSFSVTPKVPSTGPALTVEWRLNDVLQGETGTTFNILSKVLGNGTHKVKAIVRDPTSWVRRDPTALLVDEVTWTLTLSNQTDPPVIATPLPEGRVLAVGDGLHLDATSTGPGPITYQWLKNSQALEPALTTPVLDLAEVSIATAGTYTVKVTNPSKTVPHSTRVAVLDANVPRLVVGRGKTATLAFAASSNLPPVRWQFKGAPIENDSRHAKTTSRTLQIKNVDVGDRGPYFFASGAELTTYPIELLVVTDSPDYSGVDLTLAVGVVGGTYDQPFPLPAAELRTPNFFSAKLPGGLKINGKTGRITGIPTVASVDQVLGDEITFTVGNEFGRVPVKTRLLIKPLPPGTVGVFSALVPSGNPIGGATGGLVTLTSLRTGAYSGRITIGTEGFNFKGKLAVTSPTATEASGQFSIKPKGAALAMAIVFTLNDAGDADPDTGNLMGGPLGGATSFSGWRNRWSGNGDADVFAGYHTYAFTVPAGGGDLPRGNGFGSVTVDSQGGTTATGKLADGARFTTVAQLSPVGEVILYQGLYTTPVKGSVFGILDLDPGVEAGSLKLAEASGVSWTRPPDDRQTARLYAGGIGPVQLGAFGGRYIRPDNDEIVMGLPAASGEPVKNADLVFDSTLGTDPQPVVADVSLDIRPQGVVKITSPNPKRVTVTIKPDTGGFSGRYTTIDNDPRSTALVPPKVTRGVSYQGIMVDALGVPFGYGFILRDALPSAAAGTTPSTSPRESGAVLLKDPRL